MIAAAARSARSSNSVRPFRDFARRAGRPIVRAQKHPFRATTCKPPQKQARRVEFPVEFQPAIRPKFCGLYCPLSYSSQPSGELTQRPPRPHLSQKERPGGTFLHVPDLCFGDQSAPNRPTGRRLELYSRTSPQAAAFMDGRALPKERPNAKNPPPPTEHQPKLF